MSCQIQGGLKDMTWVVAIGGFLITVGVCLAGKRKAAPVPVRPDRKKQRNQ